MTEQRCGTCEYRGKQEWPSVRAVCIAPLPFWVPLQFWTTHDREYVTVNDGKGCAAYKAADPPQAQEGM